MTHIGLFEGIGGFSLAAKWMEWNTIAWCEWNLFAQKILNYHFPKAKQHGDITKTDFNIYRGKCDILTGGFPCQPFSNAGKRKGKADERHLWPEMLRAIREIQPRWVVGENVGGIINWSGGMVFEEVQIDLEIEGYEVWTYVLPACAVNAPHRRDRVWFIARRKTNTDTNGNGLQQIDCKNEINTNNTRINALNDIKPIYSSFNNTVDERLQRRNIPGNIREKKKKAFKKRCESTRTIKPNYQRRNWQDFPTQSPICVGNDGFPGQLDGITFSKWRTESIKAAGNAIVPQLAFKIFKAIAEIESK